MLEIAIAFLVVVICLVWLFPHRTIHRLSDHWQCRRLIRKYKLDSLKRYRRFQAEIHTDVAYRTRRRYYDYGFRPVEAAPEWQNDEIYRPNHWRANHRDTVLRIMGLIRKKLG